MYHYSLIWGLAAAMLVGCAAAPPVRPLAMNDPSNPKATEAPLPMASDALAMNNSAGEPGAMPEGAGGMNPDMPGMSSDMPGMGSDMPGMSHKTSGMDPNMPGMDMHGMAGMHDMAGMHHPMSSAATQAAGPHDLYTCKMHPKVISDKPGKCPICGMKLIKKPAPAQKEMNK